MGRFHRFFEMGKGVGHNCGKHFGTAQREQNARPVKPKIIMNRNVEKLESMLSPCRICPRECGVDRAAGEVGACRAGMAATVSSIGKHFGEEPPISGSRGSGTIFFTRCNLSCVFCQNHQISQPGGREPGLPYSPEELAEQMMALERAGAHNINFVSPTQWTPQAAKAIVLSREAGLTIPIVWNSNGYERVETIRLLEGLVEIYMPDFKYGQDDSAVRLSNAPRYPEIAAAAIREMFRQVGELTFDESGVAQRGVIVRHLVLPNGLAGTRSVLCSLATEVSPNVFVSLMSQYYPTHRAREFRELRRSVRRSEYAEALRALEEFGLSRGWSQDYREAPLRFRPDFEDDAPFEEWD